MSISATPHNGFIHRPEQRPTVWLAALIEAAASLMALYSIGAMLINKADTTVAFFGETPTVTSENVSTYHDWLVTLGVAILLSLAAALWRQGPTSRWLYWHGLVLLAGLVSAVAFHVTGASETPEPIPVQDQSGSVCHSGGDNTECVGG